MGRIDEIRGMVAAATVVVVAAAACAAASAAGDEQAVGLILPGAAGANSPVVVDLALRGGRFEPDVWAAAYAYNHNQHAGMVTASEAEGKLRLSVRLKIQPDAIAPGGPAAYEISLTRKDGEFSGTYTGTFIDSPVGGPAAGRVTAAPVRAVPGWKAPAGDEHPRLIFRKDDLPELRRRMETPEGRAILAMLKTRAPLRQPAQVTDRHFSWMAANWGAIWQLTGDKDAPRKAREVLMNEVITRPLPGDRKDIHHATRLLGIALTYDLCFDAWDAEFRRLVAEYLSVAAEELAGGVYEGFRMSAEAFDAAPWGHRNAIRMSCAGLAALAIAGDGGTSGRSVGDVGPLLRSAERHVTTYLRTGISQSGGGLEGGFYRDFALAGGVLQYMQASRLAGGRDLSGVNRYLLAGGIVAARMEGEAGLDFGLASISVQASGLWPMGLGSAPREFLPALRWCFDRDVGLAGKRHFGCAYPYQAAYALANYPLDAPAKAPGEALGLMVEDAEQGHFLFRGTWRDANDALVEMYLNLQSAPPVRLKSGDLTTGVLNVEAFGLPWVRGFVGPSRLNDAAGAEVLYSQVSGKQALVGMDLTRPFTVEPDRYRRGPGRGDGARGVATAALSRKLPTAEEVREFLTASKPAGTVAPKAPPKGPSAPPGPVVRMIRHLAVDLSGECGAPVLIAIVDRCEGLAGAWRVPLAAKLVSAAPGQFVAGEEAGANLAGCIVTPAGARLSGGQVPAAKEYFVVFTIQRGSPPAVKVEGAALGAKVVIGGRTVAFDGRRIVLGK